MIPIPATDILTPGTVIVPTGELARYNQFFSCLLSLRVPAGTSVIHAKSSDICNNINFGIENMVGDWVFVLGDDHTFPTNTLTHLLQRQVDMVVMLCSMRLPPHHPVVFRHYLGDGEYLRYMWKELPSSGMMEVVAAGGPALIRKRVLDAVGKPWFEPGKGRAGVLGEDLHFMQKVRERGFKIYCDFDLPSGHVTPAIIMPAKGDDGKIHPGVAFTEDGKDIHAFLPEPVFEITDEIKKKMQADGVALD